MPAVTDTRRHRPDSRLSWVVEEAYAPLARLHRGVDAVIPVASFVPQTPSSSCKPGTGGTIGSAVGPNGTLIGGGIGALLGGILADKGTEATLHAINPEAAKFSLADRMAAARPYTLAARQEAAAQGVQL